VILGPLLAAAVAIATPARQVVQSVTSSVQRLAISSDGYAATIDSEMTLRIWHLPSRTLVRRLSESQLGGMVRPIAMTWDDSTHELLIARGADLLAVDVEGHMHGRPGEGERFHTVAGTGKPRWIFGRYGRWDVRDAQMQSLGSFGPAGDAVASGDGSTAAVLTRDSLVTYTLDPFAKKQTIALPGQPLGSRTEFEGTLALTRDGATAVVCVDSKPGVSVIVVDKLRGAPVQRKLAVPKDIFNCQLSIDDDRGLVVVGAVDTLMAFELATGALRWQAPIVNADMTGALEIARHDRDVFASIGGGALRMFDIARGDAIGELGHPLFVPRSIAFIAGDRVVATRTQASIFSSGQLATIWSLANASVLSTGGLDWGSAFDLDERGNLAVVRQAFYGNVGKLTVDPMKESCFIFSVGTAADSAPIGEVARDVWPPRPGKSSMRCIAPNTLSAIDPARGRFIAGPDGKSELLAPGAKPVPLADSGGGIAGLTFELHGNWVAGHNLQGNLGSFLGQLSIWDARTGKKRTFLATPKSSPTPKPFYAYAISDDGARLVVAGEDTATIYTLADGNAVHTITLPASAGSITAAAFIPGGEIALGTHDGHLAVTRGGKPSVGGGDGIQITQIGVRRDGARIATISQDGGVRVWKAATGELEATLVEFADGEHLATTPGGAYAGAPEAAERVSWVFDAPTEGFTFERFAHTFARADVVAKRLRGDKADLAASIVRPPRIEIVQPPPATTDAAVAIRVHVASDAKVKEVRAFVEGRPVIAQPVTAADFQLDIPLEPGTDVVTLLAFDDAGRSSNPTSFEIASKQQGPRPDVWIVAAGVGWYPNLPENSQLAAPVNDARAIADAFAAQAGPGQIYGDSHVTVLEDEQVTPEALEKALAGLAAMKPNDVAIVFLAGHGVKPPKRDEMVFLTSAAGKDPTTWTQNGLGWSALGKALQAARGRVLVLLDACHSGHVTQELLVPNSKLADDLVHAQRAGALVFAASKGAQESFEENAARGLVLDAGRQKLVGARPPRPRPQAKPAEPAPAPTAQRPRSGHGYFTGAVIAALEAATTDTNRDGAIELSELISQVTLRVVAASDSKQTPWVARRELFGDFGLAKVTAP
jgi:WD40 repeat protein